MGYISYSTDVGPYNYMNKSLDVDNATIVRRCDQALNMINSSQEQYTIRYNAYAKLRKFISDCIKVRDEDHKNKYNTYVEQMKRYESSSWIDRKIDNITKPSPVPEYKIGELWNEIDMHVPIRGDGLMRLEKQVKTLKDIAENNAYKELSLDSADLNFFLLLKPDNLLSHITKLYNEIPVEIYYGGMMIGVDTQGNIQEQSL